MLEAIRERLDAASTGPWQRHGADVHAIGGRLFTGRDGASAVRAQADRDAEFVAHAREDIATLLDRLTRLETDDPATSRSNRHRREPAAD